MDVQHFGSTAIPSMLARPIIQLLGGVASVAVADALVMPLLQSGSTMSAEFNGALTDRRWLMGRANGPRTQHVHLVVTGSVEWQRRLRFRDALRVPPSFEER